jgi:hypothetical protein
MWLSAYNKTVKCKNAMLCLSRPQGRMGGVDLYLHLLLASVLYGGAWLSSLYGRLTFRKTAQGVNRVGSWVSWVSWVSPTAGLNFWRREKHLAPSKNQTPARSIVIIPTSVQHKLQFT